MKLTAHWPNDLEMPKVVHNVQFTMTNVQSVLLIGQSVVEFIEVFRSITNCRIYRRIVMKHWPNANEKRCSSPSLEAFGVTTNGLAYRGQQRSGGQILHSGLWPCHKSWSATKKTPNDLPGPRLAFPLSS